MKIYAVRTNPNKRPPVYVAFTPSERCTTLRMCDAATSPTVELAHDVAMRHARARPEGYMLKYAVDVFRFWSVSLWGFEITLRIRRDG